nr:hypothetical protein [Candidatus Cloacimonadota bacterium]
MKKIALCLSLLLCVTIVFGTEFSWFSQTDSRWETDRLGRSTSIGRSGCVVSCLSMLLNQEASNPYMTPAKLNEWLRKNGGYSGNNMRWQVPSLIDGEGLGLELVAESFRANDWDFLSQELEKGNKVIVKVAKRRSHWVLVVKQDGPSNKASSYIVNDPGMSQYEQRTLGYWGGFRSARSYSGNWLDEDTFNLCSDIQVVPINGDESFLYDIFDLPTPADVFVSIKNNLDVPIQGFFLLGLFDGDDNLLDTVDMAWAEIGPESEIDLIYEMADYSPLEVDSNSLKIIYSKYFSSMPSRYETLHIKASGISNLTNSD